MELAKVIITIPKDKYQYIQELEYGNTDYATTRMLYHAVKVGTLLDDVKAEIRELRDSWEKDCYHDEAEALNIALKIIDKHRGKAESEG